MRALVLLVACAGPGQSLRKPDAVLVVECDLPSASVYVDERFAGRAAELGAHGLSVRHGNLRVEVRADGYYPAYREVPVAAGGRAQVKLSLHAVPEGER